MTTAVLPGIRYGVIDYSRGYGHLLSHQAGSSHHVNIGDDIQSLAVLHFYRRLGIPDEQIVWVGHDELGTYSRSYVVLPMNMFGTKGDIFPLSPYIIPLFIGFNYVSGKVRENAEFLHRHGPIGCRDEYTLRIMREAGIESYLSGCLSIALPRRDASTKASRVFIVDAPQELDAHIPENLRERVEYLTHEIEFDWTSLTEKAGTPTYELAELLLRRYAEEATLVVTGRLHCAAPCIALGIPVILVKENIESNLSWIDKFVKVYGIEDLCDIDWNPQALDVEHVKEHLFALFSERLQALIASRRYLCELSAFYEERARSRYSDGLARLLDENMSRLDRKPYNYAIWGVGAGGTLAHLLIRETFPDFRMVAAVDAFERGEFFGLPIRHPDDLDDLNYDFLFVCTFSGQDAAERKLGELGLEKHTQWMHLVVRTVNHHREVNEAFRNQLKGISQP